MAHETLHERLQSLGHKIHAAEVSLREEAHLYREDLHLTAKELKTRYTRLKARHADAEAHDHHLTDLERSVQQWLDSIDTTHTASK